MIQITPLTPIFVHTGFTDFRKGIDGLCGVCKYELEKDPMTGAMFVFGNRTRKALKILIYDGQGFWVYHKRLSRGRFKWWPESDKVHASLVANQLSVLIWNGDPQKAKMQSNWKNI